MRPRDTLGEPPSGLLDARAREAYRLRLAGVGDLDAADQLGATVAEYRALLARAHEMLSTDDANARAIEVRQEIDDRLGELAQQLRPAIERAVGDVVVGDGDGRVVAALIDTARKLEADRSRLWGLTSGALKVTSERGISGFRVVLDDSGGGHEALDADEVAQ